MSNRSLTEAELTALSSITAGGTANFAAGYDFVAATVLPRLGVSIEAATNFWFSRAGAINRNDASDLGNVFIRGVTEAGLRMAGRAHDAVTMQAISDAIGRQVIQDILVSENTPELNILIGTDARVAMDQFNVTLGGWGGSFYYWHLLVSLPGDPPGSPPRTVGERILADRVELERFYVANAEASLATLNSTNSASLQQGLSALNSLATVQDGRAALSLYAGQWLTNFGSAVQTGLSAGVPREHGIEVFGRAIDLMVGGGGRGDPNVVDGYVRRLNENGQPEWVRVLPTFHNHLGMNDLPTTVEISANPAEIAAFEAVRALRLTGNSTGTSLSIGDVQEKYNGVFEFTTSNSLPNGLYQKILMDGSGKILREASGMQDGSGSVKTFDWDASTPKTHDMVRWDAIKRITEQTSAYADGTSLRQLYDVNDTERYHVAQIAYDTQGRADWMQEWLDPINGVYAGQIVTDWDQARQSGIIEATQVGADGQERISFSIVWNDDRTQVHTHYNYDTSQHWTSHQIHLDSQGQQDLAYLIFQDKSRQNIDYDTTGPVTAFTWISYHFDKHGAMTSQLTRWDSGAESLVEHDPGDDQTWVRVESEISAGGALDLRTIILEGNARIIEDYDLGDATWEQIDEHRDGNGTLIFKTVFWDDKSKTTHDYSGMNQGVIEVLKHYSEAGLEHVDTSGNPLAIRVLT